MTGAVPPVAGRDGSVLLTKVAAPPPAEALAASPSTASISPVRATLLRGRRPRNTLVVLSVAWLGGMAALAILAGLLPLRSPDAVSDAVSQPPGLRWPEFLGTDDLGRSELSRIIYGARASLAVGICATLAALVVGVCLGVLAGYLRGAVDWVVGLVTDTALAFPPLIFLLALVSVLSPSVTSLTLALALLATPLFIRVARANTLVFGEREFVLAALAMGASRLRVIRREILPNVLLPVSSYALVAAAAIMVAEGALSFLGLGIRPPQASWGTMIAAGQPNLETQPHEVFVPAVAFVLTIVALNTLGDWMRGRFGRGAQ